MDKRSPRFSLCNLSWPGSNVNAEKSRCTAAAFRRLGCTAQPKPSMIAPLRDEAPSIGFNTVRSPRRLRPCTPPNPLSPPPHASAPGSGERISRECQRPTSPWRRNHLRSVERPPRAAETLHGVHRSPRWTRGARPPMQATGGAQVLVRGKKKRMMMIAPRLMMIAPRLMMIATYRHAPNQTMILPSTDNESCRSLYCTSFGEVGL